VNPLSWAISATLTPNRQNANSIPIIGWCLIELIKDPALFAAVREEVDTAFDIDSTSGFRRVDLKKLADLPLLQSIYSEALRVHVSIAITREVIEDVILDEYILKKGYLVQAPGMIAHLDQPTWGVEGHPASEFWAERHITYVDEVDSSGNSRRVKKFSLANKAGGGSLVAFGGGVSICPGRHFAKQEIMSVVAMLVVNLDMELKEWMQMDGTKSDRVPLDDQRYCGTAAMPPDRDARIRWRRRES
jgi:cytochrome P450